ncbi:hypothetical protein ZWY2020_054601 [Hordeum vulgare]|nr:hypothetical protein ZWY2020_054601 [Hordeum vulgare]
MAAVATRTPTDLDGRLRGVPISVANRSPRRTKNDLLLGPSSPSRRLLRCLAGYDGGGGLVVPISGKRRCVAEPISRRTHSEAFPSTMQAVVTTEYGVRACVLTGYVENSITDLDTDTEDPTWERHLACDTWIWADLITQFAKDVFEENQLKDADLKAALLGINISRIIKQIRK